MLSRAARSPGAAAARRPYVPLAITFIGLMVAYRAFSDFQTLEPMDLLILSLFIVALLSVLGMQFFIIDKHADDK